MHIFFLGYPGAMGGANTECWHTAKVWRQPASRSRSSPPGAATRPWRTSLAAIGCRTIHAGSPDNLAGVPGFAGSIVVGMCNSHVDGLPRPAQGSGLPAGVGQLHDLPLRQRDPAPSAGTARPRPSSSSRFSAGRTGKGPAGLRLLPGAGPRDPRGLRLRRNPLRAAAARAGRGLFIGRLARPDLDKWSSNHWHILGPRALRQRRAPAMGWTRSLSASAARRRHGPRRFAPQQIARAGFLGRCHAMLGLNGGARENWPRIGLEAMAAGVPLVAQNQWGWREMIVDGADGLPREQRRGDGLSPRPARLRRGPAAGDHPAGPRDSPRAGLPGADRRAVVRSCSRAWGRRRREPGAVSRCNALLGTTPRAR